MTSDGDDDDQSFELGARLAGWARHHWLLVATVIALLIVLLFPSVWRDSVEVGSRNGMSTRMARGERGLWLSGLGAVIYALAGALAGIGLPRHWAMRPPGDGERIVARWLLRAFGLAMMWIALYVTIPR
jgi:hypothetical protein